MAKKLNLPINFTPKFFPPSDVVTASCLILFVKDQNMKNLLSLNLLKCVWVKEKDIGDINTLVEVCNNLGLNGNELLEKSSIKGIDKEDLFSEILLVFFCNFELEIRGEITS